MTSGRGKNTKDEPFSVASHPTSNSRACRGCGSLPVPATWGTQCFSGDGEGGGDSTVIQRRD